MTDTEDFVPVVQEQPEEGCLEMIVAFLVLFVPGCVMGATGLFTAAAPFLVTFLIVVILFRFAFC